MGIVWEAYHKGVPLLGVARITLELGRYYSKSSQIFQPTEVSENQQLACGLGLGAKERSNSDP